MAGKKPAAAHIARMVKRVAKKFHPQQIILFGSHARGEAGPDSDVDLLVVMPVRGSVRGGIDLVGCPPASQYVQIGSGHPLDSQAGW